MKLYSSKSKHEFINNSKVFQICFIIGSLFIIVYSLVGFCNLIAMTETVTGEIYISHVSSPGSSLFGHPVYTYEVDGVEYCNGDNSYYITFPPKGTPVLLNYNPKDPNKVCKFSAKLFKHTIDLIISLVIFNLSLYKYLMIRKRVISEIC